MIILQAVVFYSVTQPAFFATDDYAHFRLAEERPFLYFLLTPILGLYPAPGHRVLTFLLHELFPLNFTVARAVFLILLAATTVVLGQLVRTFAKSDEWWTVALLAPFAFSLTLLLPMWWWSNGLPVLPLLFFTAVALSCWLKSYTEPRETLWLALTVMAIAAAGAFYIKFVLIPVYFLLLRLWVLPRLLDLSGGIRGLWEERTRWIAFAVPPAAYVAVFVLSGLAGRTVTTGERPFLEYFAAAWFHALVPASFVNAELSPATRFSFASWVIVVLSHVILIGVVFAMWKRSSVALRAWMFFVAVFVFNAAMVGAARLASFGVDIAYALRYYPEVVFFLPLVLGLSLRQGAERRPEVAWEHTRAGRALIGMFAFFYAGSLLVWAPPIIRGSEGAQARTWFDNLRHDLTALADDETPTIVDSETPEYVIPQWMAPHNRVSTILGLTSGDVVYNRLVENLYLVRDDGQLAEATFHPSVLLLSREANAGEAVELSGEFSGGTDGACLSDAGFLRYRPDTEVRDPRLAIKVSYAGRGQQPAVVEVQFADDDLGSRRMELDPEADAAELIMLGAFPIREVVLKPEQGGSVCLKQVDLGSLAAGPGVRGAP